MKSSQKQRLTWTLPMNVARRRVYAIFGQCDARGKDGARNVEFGEEVIVEAIFWRESAAIWSVVLC